MSSSPSSDRRWKAQPLRAAALRLAAVVVPVLASVVAGAAVSAALPPAATLGGVVTQWTAVLGASTATALLVERVTRRLLPLATLLKLSMLFPDRAPSRFKVARQVAGTRVLAAELERARKAGVHGDRQHAAETILALVGLLGDYDSRTKGHSERTQLFVSMLADEMKLRPEHRDKLVWAALVHDIGKLRVPTEVLNKPGKPDDVEWAHLRAHPAAGATICSPLQEWLGPWWHAIEQHHERHDGLGYPRGLSGDQISLAARIVSVADSYEVMTAARPYKKAMSATAARAELAQCAGSQFDPVVVRAFLTISLGRLRWAAGPLAWLAQLPLLQPVSTLGPHVAPVFGKLAGVTAAVATAGVALLGLGLGPTAAQAVDAVAAPTQVEVDELDERPTTAATTAPTTAPAVPVAPTASPASPPPVPSSPARIAPAPVRPVPTPNTPAPPAAAPTPSAQPELPEKPVGGPPVPSPTTTPPAAPAANNFPVAADDSATTPEDTPLTLAVLDNDTDADGDTLTATTATGPTHGTATLTGTDLTYQPDSDWNGTDTLTYTLTDPSGATSTATVTLVVDPVNDAPTAADDSFTVVAGTQLVGDVSFNDGDEEGDALVVVSDDSPQIDVAPNGTFAWTPATPEVYTFRYTVSDGAAAGSGTVTITVTAAPPVQQGLFLIGSPAGTRGALSPTPPVAAGDWDSDGRPGLTIAKSSLKPGETDSTKFHEWEHVVPQGGLVLNGPVRLELSSRTAKLDLDGAHVDYSLWLSDCDAAGDDCRPLAVADDVHVDRWSPGPGWENRTLEVGSVNETLPAGRVLRLRMAVDHNAVQLALDDAHPSRLVWSTGD